MNLESLYLEPVAVGIYSLGVYVFLTNLWPGKSMIHFYYILFGTGVIKHISAWYLGLQDYFCHFHFQRISRQLTETEIGKNPGGKEFREKIEYLVTGSLIEGSLFLLAGSGIYWLLGLRKSGNLFLTAVTVCLLADFLGFQKILCHRAFLTNWG
jgi:hypothetical protein